MSSQKEKSKNTERQSVPSFDDDLVIPFQTERSGTLGRLVRLGPTINKNPFATRLFRCHLACTGGSYRTYGDARFNAEV